jgi:catechol 2,3-dioxygenase-like lactoylglutathione lyase family enzyme
MIGYVTLGTRDLARAAEFYDAIGAEMGVSRMGGDERYIAWGVPGGGAGIGITLPFDGEPATVGNGVMVALEAKDQQQVDRLHALALSLGGTCEGAPGERFPAFTPPISATGMATSSTPMSLRPVPVKAMAHSLAPHLDLGDEGACVAHRNIA